MLVRIITTQDEDIRNSIILATNQQNSLPQFAMRATDPWQKDIETYIGSRGYYYDRRKNFYKNQGKPAAKVITIPYLAQASYSIGFSHPDAARARPSTLIANDTTYESIFRNDSSLPGYFWMARMQQAVDVHLRASDAEQVFKSNMRFHLSMMVAQDLIEQQVHHPSQLAEHFSQDIDTSSFDKVMQELKNHLEQYAAEKPDFTYDRIAKSAGFTEYILSQRYS